MPERLGASGNALRKPPLNCMRTGKGLNVLYNPFRETTHFTAAVCRGGGIPLRVANWRQ